MIYYSCLSCRSVLSTNNFEKHHSRCVKFGGKFKSNSSIECRYCDRNFKNALSRGQHELCCKSNPNRSRGNYCPISFCVVCQKLIKDSQNKTCSKDCYKSNLRSFALRNPSMGGNKNNRAFGWYVSPIAGKIWLESTYEFKVASELDRNGIRWLRPKGIKYQIDGVERTYFADFYLIDFDTFLDPKNDYLIEKDDNKIMNVQKQKLIKILILDKYCLTWECIKARLT